MTRDDIIRQLYTVFRTPTLLDIDTDKLHGILDAVAAAEREKVAHWMIQRSYATGHGDTIEDLLSELEWQIRESEREVKS